MTEQNKPALIQGTVTVDYQQFKIMESKAEAWDRSEPEAAALGVEIAIKAKGMLEIESQDNGEGIISVSDRGLYDLIQLITGVRPIELHVKGINGSLVTVV